jgi:hypothetical protein
VRVSLYQRGALQPYVVNHAIPTYLKDGKIGDAPKPMLELTEHFGSVSNDYCLSIKNKMGSTPALYVTLESTTPGYFSENAFHLLPGEQKKLVFVAVDGDDKIDLSQIKIRSYNDMLNYV